MSRRITIALLLAAVACGGDGGRSADHMKSMAGALADSDSAAMPMHGMPSRAMGSGTMAEEMRTHMRAMQAMSADTMHATMPMHRQMATAMLDQMTREIADRKVASDPRWTALMDSVRRDIAAMPGMNASELARMMPIHHARVTRLMDLHRSMMGTMPPPG